MSNQFKKGDVVKHKSGTGPHMVVQYVEENNPIISCEFMETTNVATDFVVCVELHYLHLEKV